MFVGRIPRARVFDKKINVPCGRGWRYGDGLDGEFGVAVSIIDEVSDKNEYGDDGEYTAATGCDETGDVRASGSTIMHCRQSHYWS